MIKEDLSKLVDSKYLKIPYKLGGRTKEEGCDCIGLAIMWLKENYDVNYVYDDNQGPILERWWEQSPMRFLNALTQHGKIITFDQVKKLDILLFFGEDVYNRFPTCLGVMIDDRHFLITMPDKGSFVTLLNLGWKRLFWGAIRLTQIVEKGLSEWQ